MTNPDVYPITAEFEQEVSKLRLNDIGRAVADRMKAHLGEYEHGTAEPEVLLDWRLRNPIYENEAALKTMKEMFLDYLRTYWLLSSAAPITVWMPDDDTSLNKDIQDDVIRAVEAAHGHIATDINWNYVAVAPQPFSGEEASKAMADQSGETAIPPTAWIEQKTGE